MIYSQAKVHRNDLHKLKYFRNVYFKNVYFKNEYSELPSVITEAENDLQGPL